MEVVAGAGTGVEAIDVAREHRPDVVLMDIWMPEMDGLQATATILDELGGAVRTVAAGGALLVPSITRRLIGRFAGQHTVDPVAAGQLAQLTERECEVVAAVARGSSNAEIAQQLFIGPATVKSHVSSVLTEPGLRDRSQIVVFAYESGVVQAGA